MLTEKELQEIEERTTRATRGPWVLQWQPDNHPSGQYGLHRILAPAGEDPNNDPHMPFFWGHGESYEHHENNGLNDGVFVAHARNDVPVLLEEIRRLRTELTRKEKQAA
jgi:hypothetical protein